jgi:hypothetical protein
VTLTRHHAASAFVRSPLAGHRPALHPAEAHQVHRGKVGEGMILLPLAIVALFAFYLVVGALAVLAVFINLLMYPFKSVKKVQRNRQWEAMIQRHVREAVRRTRQQRAWQHFGG